MSDWHETKETQEQDISPETTGEKLSPRGIGAMQGNVDAQDMPTETYPNQKFTDAQGHDLTMRTYPSGDSYYVRVYDDEKTPEPPESATYGDAGRANLHLERDANGDVARARLQDVETLPSYRGAGTGSRTLKQCEDIARRNGAGEIYGDFTSEEGKEEETRQWYMKRGYAFGQNGREVYKTLSGGARDITDTHDSGTGLSSEGIRAMQGVEPTTPPNDQISPSEPTESTSEGTDSQQVTLKPDIPVNAKKGHLVSATVFEGLDTLVDEKKAAEIAKHEYPHQSIQDLPDANLRGVAHEGTVYRQLEDERGPDHVPTHPKGLALRDGRRIEPDFGVTDDKDNLVELVDAKGYTRKYTHNPQASASSLTHMQNLKKASRYTEVDETTVKGVKFYVPEETAKMKAVQKAVSGLGTDERPVSIEVAGTEAGLKQRMADLRKDPAERFSLSDRVRSEIERIQALPVEERRAAMGEFVQSLTDDKGDQTTEGRNLRGWRAQIERNGDGITITRYDGQEEYTIWFVDDRGTTHPRKHPETLPELERQPTTITTKGPEKSKPKPPEGWHPDPERSG